MVVVKLIGVALAAAFITAVTCEIWSKPHPFNGYGMLAATPVSGDRFWALRHPTLSGLIAAGVVLVIGAVIIFASRLPSAVSSLSDNRS